ncbi:hypothetical protein GCM10008939_33400 [Deinococcus aquiradiocola]|uniref:Uncharacterized protein n=1 Tax=Deinococcus aquiradiocola TaxID=393059 RepID=A0A917PPS2_9DEIO|nr:hypothetical protein GCM10008939_33400 [Deinococcus aquiradiocola]
MPGLTPREAGHGSFCRSAARPDARGAVGLDCRPFRPSRPDSAPPGPAPPAEVRAPACDPKECAPCPKL